MSLNGQVHALFIYWQAAQSQNDIRVEPAHVILLGAQPLLRSCGRLSPGASPFALLVI